MAVLGLMYMAVPFAAVSFGFTPEQALIMMGFYTVAIAHIVHLHLIATVVPAAIKIAMLATIVWLSWRLWRKRRSQL